MEVLKILRKSYFNSIDVIYIDPPYNTGNDSFVYNDKFQQSLDDYKEMIDENHEWHTNTKSNGRFHTNWLNMIYSRLKVAHQLLKDDGVIFISIDDNEQARLKLICDEIFGEQNFVGNIIWHARRGGGNDAKHIANDHEYILTYAKNINKCLLIGKLKNSEDFSFIDEYYESRGKYNLQQFDRASLTYTKSLDYPIEAPDGTQIFPGHVTHNKWLERKQDSSPRNDWRWMMSEETFLNAKKHGFIVFENKNDKWNVKVKTYEKATYKDPKKLVQRFLKLRSILNNDFGITRDGNIDIDNLLLKKHFTYPKPIKLLKNIFQYFNNDNLKILDFFAGSGTTGQAVMELNKEDGGNRKYILVQINEELEDQSEFKTIADITRERIKRSIEKFGYKEKGFKYFEVTPTNLVNLDNQWLDLENNKQISFDEHISSIKPNVNLDDLIYEIILKEGLKIDIKLITKNIFNQDVIIDESQSYLFGFNFDNYNNIFEIINQIWQDKNGDGTLKIFLLEDKLTDEIKINLSEKIKSICSTDSIHIEVI